MKVESSGGAEGGIKSPSTAWKLMMGRAFILARQYAPTVRCVIRFKPPLATGGADNSLGRPVARLSRTIPGGAPGRATKSPSDANSTLRLQSARPAIHVHSRQLSSRAYFYRVKVHRRPVSGADRPVLTRSRPAVRLDSTYTTVVRMRLCRAISAIALGSITRSARRVMSVQPATTFLIEFKPFPVV